MRSIDREVDGFEERGLERAVAEQAEGVARHRTVVARALERIGDGVMTLHQRLGLFQVALLLLERLDGTLPEIAVDRATGVILALTESIGGGVTRRAEAVRFEPDAALATDAFDFEFPADTTTIY